MLKHFLDFDNLIFVKVFKRVCDCYNPLREQLLSQHLGVLTTIA